MTRFTIALFLLVACGGSPSEGGGSGAVPAAEAKAPPAPAAATSAPGGDVDPATVVASWDGGQVTYGDLSTDIKSQLIKLQVDYLTQKYETESDALQNKVIEQLLNAEAKSRGLADANALLDAEVKQKVTDPTDAEVADFYPQVARQLRNKPLEEVKDQVKGALRQRKERERFMAYIEEVKTKNNVKISLPMPNLPRMDVSVDDDPMRGSPDAKVTIIQFADFQCPYCGKANQTMTQVLKDYDGKVKMVFRDFPLGFHASATPAAVATNCAGKQGKYWEMFDQVMPNQSALDEADLLRYAQAAKVDINKWQECRKDPAMVAEVEKDQADGAALGVTGTPAFFVNGIMMSGALPYDQFKSIIDRELAGG